jgi:Hemerythrin HHE cation binding domain
MNDNTPDVNAWAPLLEEHRLLMKQIADFRAWAKEVDELGIPHFREMGNRLRTLRDVLSCHFIDEEAGGYLAPILDAAPRFSAEAAELQTQHAEFLTSLDGLIARLFQEPPEFPSWQSAVKEFEDFLETLRQHEARENAMAQSAFGRDIGAAD